MIQQEEEWTEHRGERSWHGWLESQLRAEGSTSYWGGAALIQGLLSLSVPMSTCHHVIITSISNFSGDKPTKLRIGFSGDKPCLFIIHFAEKMRTMGISCTGSPHLQYWFLGANLEFGV